MSYISGMATPPPPSLQLAGGAYWPIKGTIPRANTVTADIDGVTYTAVAQAVNSTFIEFRDGTAPGVDKVQAIALNLTGPGYWVYDPLTEELARVVKVDLAMWKVDNTFIRVEVDRPMTTAAATVVELVWPAALSVGLVNSGATNVLVDGTTLPPGLPYNASGFAERGMPSLATTPITYDATGGSLLISVNP